MKHSPDLKIGATLLKFGRGANATYQARLGVLHADASTAAQAKAVLSERVATILSDPANLLRLALEAAALNDVNVAAIAAECGFRLAPIEVHTGAQRVALKDLADGMLVVCGRGRALALVQQRTPLYGGAQPSLFVEWVQWGDDLWRPGGWFGEWLGCDDAQLGEIEVLANGLPRGVSGFEVRRLAERAGWPDRFVGVERGGS